MYIDKQIKIDRLSVKCMRLYIETSNNLNGNLYTINKQNYQND